MNVYSKFAEIVPLLIFVALFSLYGIYYATVGIVAYCSVHTIYMLFARVKNKVMWLTNLMIIVFGGLSIISSDLRFIKMKPTALYLVFASVLSLSAMRRHPVLKRFLSKLFTFSERQWQRSSYLFSAYFILCAILNEWVWRNFDDKTWIQFKILVMPFISLAAIIFFLLLNRRHITKEKFRTKQNNS